MKKPLLQRLFERLKSTRSPSKEEFLHLKEMLARLELQRAFSESEDVSAYHAEFSRIFLLYDQGRYADAKESIFRLRDHEDVISLGPTKFVFGPKNLHPEYSVYGNWVFYLDLAPSAQRAFTEANAFLEKQNSTYPYSVLELKEKIPSVIMARYVDAPLTDEFLMQFPDTSLTQAVLAHSIRTQVLLGFHFSSRYNEIYEHEEKMKSSLQSLPKNLVAVLARETAQALTPRSHHSCGDCIFQNHFVQYSHRSESQLLALLQEDTHSYATAWRNRDFSFFERMGVHSSLPDAVDYFRKDLAQRDPEALLDEPSEFQKAHITHDKDLVNKKSTHGHHIGDIILRTPVSLSQMFTSSGISLEDWAINTYCERTGIPRDTNLYKEMALRSLRLSYRFGFRGAIQSSRIPYFWKEGFGVTVLDSTHQGLAEAIKENESQIRDGLQSLTPRTV